MSLEVCIDTWSRQGEGYVFLSEKSPGGWKDHSFKWPGEKDKIRQTFKRLSKNPQTDLYWAPLIYLKPRRLIELALPSNVLFADLDPVDPRGITITPTVAWESSKKRYQALWYLDKIMSPSELESFNKALSYSIGADKGGWDLTQVLRIPGTSNYKYKPSIKGKLLWADGSIYNKEVFPKSFESATAIPETSLIDLLHKYRKKIPTKVSKMLQYPPSRVEQGKRSDILWYIEAELIKAQIPLEDIITLVRLSSWNKYKGRADELKRLKTEITKVYEKDGEERKVFLTDEELEEENLTEGLPIVGFGDLMGRISYRQGWLVKDIWLKGSNGIIAGEPKTLKSTMTMDLAISVASGKPLWGIYPVDEQGPVLIIQNENSEWIIKDRFEKILNHRGLVGEIDRISSRKFKVMFPPELPIYFLNNFGYTFDDPLHRQEMEKSIEQVKPILIIFDPLYLMFEGDMNSAKDLQPVLFWLSELKNKYKASVIVVHHWNKSGSSPRGGQRMLGSTTLHGWTESAVYIESKGSDTNEKGATLAKIAVEREFRAAGLYPKLNVDISMANIGEMGYEVTINEIRSEQIGPVDLLDLLSQYPKGISVRALSKEMDASRDKITRMIEQAGDKIEITKGGQGRPSMVKLRHEEKEE